MKAYSCFVCLFVFNFRLNHCLAHNMLLISNFWIHKRINEWGNVVARPWLSSLQNTLMYHFLWQNVASWIGQNTPHVAWLSESSSIINSPNLELMLRWAQPDHDKRDYDCHHYGGLGLESQNIHLQSWFNLSTRWNLLYMTFLEFFPFGPRGFPTLGRLTAEVFFSFSLPPLFASSFL